MRFLSADGLSLLKQRNFVLFMVTRLLGNIGAQMQTVAVGWQVYAKTGDPLDLGWVGLSQFAPFILCILPAGYFADHHERRRILMLCYTVQTLCALGLAAYTWSDAAAVWPIFVIMTLLGLARAFAMPAGQSLLPNLVRSDQFGPSVAINSTVFQVSSIVGPTLGGLLLLAGVQAVYLIVTLCAIASFFSIKGVRENAVASAAPVAAEGWRAVLTGLNFVRSRPLVLGAISLDLVAVLFGGATALLPIYARDILHVGPSGLGMLRSAPGVGAVVCALWLTARPISNKVGLWLFGGVLTYGLSIMMFGISTHFWLSMCALAMLGASDMMSVFVRNYLVQLVTPDAIRGRVSAVTSVFIGASNELGEFESGVTAAWWGTARAVIVGGAVTVSVSLLWMKLFPSLRQMDRFPAPVR
jgi:MFS family permease